MVNRVFHDSVKHSFVRIVTARNLFRQILDGKIPNLLFEELVTLAPSGDEFVPGAVESVLESGSWRLALQEKRL
jgi:hypothetical protein